MVVRARALVGFEAERKAASRGGLGSVRWLFGGPRHALQQGVMAVAALVIATGGFVVGGGLGEIARPAARGLFGHRDRKHDNDGLERGQRVLCRRRDLT